jgi:hypothetical protein
MPLLAAITGFGVAALFLPSVAGSAAHYMDVGSAALTGGGLTALVLFFLPAVVAINRKMACGASVVFIANLLVGWTLIGRLVWPKSATSRLLCASWYRLTLPTSVLVAST